MSIERLNEIADKMAKAKSELQEFAKTEGRAAIGAAFAKCFEPPTSLTAIRWTQYTPHFNDGDACTFGVHEPYMVTEAADGSEKEFDSYDIERKQTDKYYDPDVEKIGAAAIAAFQSLWPIDESILEAVFGDHCQVTITKDDVTVEEYEHD